MRLKRLFDLLVVIAAMPVWVPVILLVALLVRLNMGKGVFFCQVRPGLHGKPFVIFKFRTMRNTRDASGRLLSDEERLTKFGKFLRSTSMDELPELVNVLAGQMSLVGPRPLLMEYLPRYSPRQYTRCNVPPGITGWAQVNGRNAIDWDKKLELDAWYVENRSVGLDIKILFLTAKSVVWRSGISAEGAATMPAFTGSAKTDADKPPRA